MSKTTLEILGHHLESFGSGKLDELLTDYTDDSVMFTPDGIVRGVANLKAKVFAPMFAEFAKPGSKFEMIRQDVDGDYGFIVWKAETADNWYEYATDTFVIRDGKIVAQTFAGKIKTKL
jgi:ketosteroid isomerase-like protein